MKWKPLLICLSTALILLGSFFWPVTFALWQSLDTAIFKTLNHTLEGHPWAQVFWACVNHKKADLVEDAVFLLYALGLFGLFAFYVLLDSLTVLSDNGVITPAMAVFVPLAFLTTLFTWRFTLKTS